MLKGFPIGYVMLWASPSDYGNTKTIGFGEKNYKRPDDLVIDGQQRLTSKNRRRKNRRKVLLGRGGRYITG